MIDLLISWLLSALALMLAARLFKRVHLEGDLGDALWVSALYALLSFFLNWFFFVFLGIATLGIGFIFQTATRLIAAAIIVKMTSALSRRLNVDGFLPALGTAVLLALFGELGSRISAIL